MEISRRLIPLSTEIFPSSTSPSVTFMCEALTTNANTSDPIWRISRIADFGGGRISEPRAGRGLFEHTCDDREDPALFPPLAFINTFSTLFDGISGEARSPDGTTLSFENNQSFTLTAWVRPLSSLNMTIFNKQDSAATFNGWAFLLNAGRPQIVLRSNLADDRIVVTAVNAIPLGFYSYLSVTWDGSLAANGITMFVNGGPVDVDISNDTLSATIINAVRFRIGRRDGNTLPFNGNIDEAGIFFTEFTALEVAELFNNGKPKALTVHSRVADLEAYWQMGDRQLFPALPDQSGNSNDLTIFNLGAGAFVRDPAVVI